MSTFIQGHGIGKWRTAEDVFRGITAAGKDGNAVSNRVAGMLSEAWGQ
jgi:hypothetical protein